MKFFLAMILNVLVVTALISKEENYILSLDNNDKWYVGSTEGDTLLLVDDMRNDEDQLLNNSIIYFYDYGLTIYDSYRKSLSTEIESSKKVYKYILKNHKMYIIDSKGNQIPVKFKFWNEGRKTYFIFESSLFSGKYRSAESEN